MKRTIKENYNVNLKIQALANYLNISSIDAIVNLYGNLYRIINDYVNDEDDNAWYHHKELYLVLTKDEAYKEATEYIQDIIEDKELLAFNDNMLEWIIHNIIIEDEDCMDTIISNVVSNYIWNLSDEELVNFAIQQFEYEPPVVRVNHPNVNIWEEQDEADDDYYNEIDGDDIEIDYDNLHSDILRYNLIDTIVDDIINNTGDYEYIVENNKDYEGIVKKWLDSSSLMEIEYLTKYIDYNEVVNKIIKANKLGLVLSSYNGEEIKLEKGFYAYRID